MIFSTRSLRAFVEGLNELGITRKNIVSIFPSEGRYNALYTVSIDDDADNGEN